MSHWVYISKDKQGVMIVGFSPSIQSSLHNISVRGDTILYLRPFKVPFDALAHKYLLEHLSASTVRTIIRRNSLLTQGYLVANDK
ncbi:hypothetical protein [Bacteroides heparinolyticus]|uniref:hypothetical protein n=2 Tax=Prevotella heparinolytica TaxID=28113 RepID=UPI0035A0D437